MIEDVMGNQPAGNAPDISEMSQTDASEFPAKTRRLPFARQAPFDDPSLAGLFALLREAVDPETRVELSRFVRERLRSAFPAGSGKTGNVTLANGLQVSVDLGDSFGAEFMIGHLNESDLLDALTANIPDGARIVDVGANFGLYALHAAWAAGPEARAVAFEPLPSAGRLLQRNLEANALSDQIRFVANAVGAEPGKADFYIAEDGAFSGLHDTKRSRLAETIEVRVVSLDASPEVSKLGSIDFLKVDVEGHEGAVLGGAEKLLENSPGILAILEYSHKNLTPDGRAHIISALRSWQDAGFRIWLHHGDGVRLCNSVADELGGDISATLILAAEACDWADGLISVLETKARKRGRSELASGLEPLLRAVRDARRVTAQADKLSERFASGVPAEKALQEVGHLLGAQEAQLETLSARIAALEVHSDSLQSKLDERLADYHALAARGSEQEAAYKSLLEQRMADLASTRERAERLAVQVAAFREQAELQQTKAKSALEATTAKLAGSRERETALAEKLSAFRAQLEQQQANANSALDAVNAELAISRERETGLATQINAFRNLTQALQEKIDARTRIMEAAIAERDAITSDAALKITELKTKVAEAETQLAQMAAELAAQAEELESRRTAIRQLQQREALLRLGKFKG